MAEELRYPGLRVKRVQGTTKIWEARAGRSIRLTFEVEGTDLILRNVGQRDDALRQPWRPPAMDDEAPPPGHGELIPAMRDPTRGRLGPWLA